MKTSRFVFVRGVASRLAAVILLVVGCALHAAEEAYLESVRQANQSFHWDHLVGGVPQTAETARTQIPNQPNDLTTIVFDPLQAGLYRNLDIQGTAFDCVLVATFTRKSDFWLSAESGQDLRLRMTAGYDVFSWVTVNGTLTEYFQTNYSSTLTPQNVDRRISQSLGLPDKTGDGRVLAFFWAPLEMVLRPAYSAEISSQIDFSNLQTYPDGSFEAEDPSAGGPGFLFQDYNYGYHSGAEGFGDFVRYNQASTQMPWTAMGYTYNWNYLEDGEAGRAIDPNRVSSLVGPSEFVVSAGSWVEFSHFVENDALYAYLVPEPGSIWLLVFAAGMIRIFRASRKVF